MRIAASLPGMSLSIINGIFFITGPVISNFYYLVFSFSGMALCALQEKRQLRADMSFLMSITFLSFSVLIAFLVAEVGNWIEGHQSGRVALYYLRGMLIATGCYFWMRVYGLERFLIGMAFGYLVIFSVLFLSISIASLFSVPSIQDLVPISTLERKYTGFIGLYNNPNYWALYSILGFVLIVHAFFTSNHLIIGRSLMLSIIAIIGISIVMTGSRMGMLSLASVILVYAAGSASVKNIVRVSAIISMLFACAYWIGIDSIYEEERFISVDRSFDRFERLFYNIQEEGRFARQAFYLKEVFSSPSSMVFGIGLGGAVDVGAPHNTLVTMLSDFGLIFLVVFVLFLGAEIVSWISFRRHVDSAYSLLWFSLLLVFIIVTISNDAIDSRAYWVLLFLVFMMRNGVGHARK